MRFRPKKNQISVDPKIEKKVDPKVGKKLFPKLEKKFDPKSIFFCTIFSAPKMYSALFLHCKQARQILIPGSRFCLIPESGFCLVQESIFWSIIRCDFCIEICTILGEILAPLFVPQGDHLEHEILATNPRARITFAAGRLCPFYRKIASAFPFQNCIQRITMRRRRRGPTRSPKMRWENIGDFFKGFTFRRYG